jgi:hypothetical protein
MLDARIGEAAQIPGDLIGRPDEEGSASGIAGRRRGVGVIRGESVETRITRALRNRRRGVDDPALGAGIGESKGTPEPILCSQTQDERAPLRILLVVREERIPAVAEERRPALPPSTVATDPEGEGLLVRLR